MYLLLKSLHIFFVIAWFAGLFYLPRIFVNLAMAQPNSSEYARLLLMAQKLYKFMLPWGIGALVCGGALAWQFFGLAGWVHLKICIGVLLAGYHLWCGALLRGFAAQRNRKSHTWFRWFNEMPVFALIAALYAVVYKPF